MRRRKKWKVNLLSGQAAVVPMLCMAFLLGSIAGCIAAGLVHIENGGQLTNYLYGCLDGFVQEDAPVRFFRVLWQTIRIPLGALVLSFTALGILGLPLLFAMRGFMLCYAISIFYRVFGAVGLLLALILFGITAILWLPALLRIGTQGMVSAYGLARRGMGDARYPLYLDSVYFINCGISAILLCLCAVTEYFAIPILLQAAARFIPAG